MSGIGPIEEDVRFDHGAAQHLVTLAGSTASTVESQRGSRLAWASTAMGEFRGYFSTLFAGNAETADADAEQVVVGLRDVARFVGQLADSAREEQARRETAREWQREQEDRNLLEKGIDGGKSLLGMGEDKPPVGDMPEPPSYAPTVVAPRPRQNPGAGSGGAGGTSSARPADLRTFATGSQGANGTLAGKPSSCRSAYDAFVAGCGWGHLEASSVFTGFDRWLDANAEDVLWTTTVADAFATAGSDADVSTLSDSAVAAALQAAGVDASRQDLDIDPPTAYGNPPSSGYADDPVNAATGNFIENEADLGFAGGTASLSLDRTYNSFDTGTGAFGPGWSSWTEAGLTVDDDAARLRLPDGRVVSFGRLGEAWDRAAGEDLWLDRTRDAASGDERLVVTGSDGTRWTFDRAGRPLTSSRGPGTTVRLVHEVVGGEARLVRLEHERGRSIDLTWDVERVGGPRVVAALASDGRPVTYDYDDAGRLLRATTPRGTRSYAWDEASLITSVTDADGVVEAENTYDEHRRVSRQRSQHGRLSRFVYLPGRVTVVSDEDGSRSNTWVSDAKGRVVGIVDAEEHRQSTSYDAHGHPVLQTARDGSTTIHEHDERGRRVRTVTPSGADVTYGYDEHDRVTTVVAESGAVTEYTYPAADEASDPATGVPRNPVRVVDPEGGVTGLSWSDGLMTGLVDPTGVTVRFTYDEHGDLVATTDATGRTARLERDGTGRVVAALSPGGHRTTYTYGAAGQLVSRRDADGAVWRYEHTAAGRLTAVVDPTGARTEVERDAHGEESRTIDPLGRAITRRVDDLGNVAAAELPDGSTWEFAHDALSRLVATTDPAGGTWRNEYDTTGGLTATVDPTGVRKEVSADRATGTVSVDDGSATLSTSFDPLGRATRSEQADGSAAMATYDRCGRPVELLDADGGLTLVARDAAGRPVAITSPSGAVTRREYDECGRLVAVVDPTGARTTQEYDADGRVARQVLPTGEVAWVERDAMGRVTARFTPGAGIARYAYDAAGRVVRSSDTWHGQRRYRYDAAGQLVEVANGNGGVTRWEYDANGRAVAITDPLGQVTRREFDAMNHCTAETDPLGRTTRAGYDAAGRQVWQTDPDGRLTEWTYDAQGRLASTAVDGRVVSSISRDLRARRLVLTDRTRTDGPDEGAVVRHELEWDRRGRMVSRTRDGRGVSWTYDADGRRTSMTTPDGSTTSYERDAAGRLLAVEHPLLGRASLTRDAAGRVVSASAGGTLQTWEHADGFVVGHTVTDAEGATRTTIERDELGRVATVAREDRVTSYEYDGAHQLLATRTGSTAPGSRASETRWRYDAAGRLVSESLDGSTREYVHDAAGQLLSVTGPDGTVTRHAYDGAGRRVRTDLPDGGVRRFSWSSTGFLSAVGEQSAAGAGDVVERRTEVHVDAHGELADVDGTEVFWDSADPYAPGLVQAGGTSVVGAGPVTGVGSPDSGADGSGGWSAAGWRTARSAATADDPWGVGGGMELPGGLEIGTSGEVSLPGAGGLELLGARVYDPASRGFLSVDPLDPVVGSGWSGNPYSYAGNDPVHAVDPTGLRPISDAELNAYIDSTKGPLGHATDAVGDWAKDNWEYVAAGAMIVAGAALMIAPVPGVAQAAGMALISAGIDTGIQKATTGEVNWGQVAVSGAAGAIGFGAGGLLARGGASAVKVAVAEGVTEGVVSGAGGYLTGPGPHTPEGLLRNTAMGAGTGVLPGPAMGDDAVRAGTRSLDDVPPVTHPPRADFIASADGVVIPTSRSRLEGGFNDAGFPAAPTDRPGTGYTLPDGSKVRVMDPSGQAPARASFTNANNGPVDAFTGKPIQPPSGLTGPERKAYVRERSHVELDP